MEKKKKENLRRTRERNVFGEGWKELDGLRNHRYRGSVGRWGLDLGV